MPYEYRKLSPEEKRAIVECRKQRGYPLHQPPHPFREEGFYLITAANYEHVPVMSTPERRTEFKSLLLGGFKTIHAEVIGWVVLPNHYHILVHVESLNLVSKVVQHIHGSTSHQWNMQDGLTGKRKIWCRFVDRAIRNETHMNQALNYIHYNPVKHGYVQDVYEWPWSSLFMYAETQGKEWLRESWKKHKPQGDFGKEWDV